MSLDRQLIIVTGPTAVGKTSISIELAQRYNTEIISCDSRQLYKEMTIGTAKPSNKELQTVKHHFINHISINEPYNTADYERECDLEIQKLFTKKDTVIMTGGTGLYIKAVLEGLDDIPSATPEVLEAYAQLFQQKGIEALSSELKVLDPEYYKTVDLQNSRRLIRALSVCTTSGKPYSSFLRNSPKELNYNVKYVVLDRPRAALYNRINKRVDHMIQDNLLAEARSLYPSKNLPALQTVGYKELFSHFDQKMNLEDAIDKIKQHSRNYAKRQLTWFRKVPNTIWIEVEGMSTEEIITKIME